MRRGQLMIEFMTLIGIGMLIVAIASAIIISEASRASQNRHESAVREQHERLRSELFAAYLALDGYTTDVTFQPPYRGVGMELRITNGSIRIESEKTATGSTVVGVIGDIQMTEGTITLSKTNGTVNVT